MKPAAVLFDMDGTIVHSEPLWMRCETEFVLSHGGEWSPERAMELVGNSLETSGQILSAAINNQMPGDQIIADIVTRMIRLYESGQIPWRPGFLECARALQAAGVKMAVVSASYSRLVKTVVAQVPDQMIDTYVGGDMVENDKPNPDPYLLAAEKLGVAITDCIVVEDSMNGLKAGLASGAATVAIPCVKPIPLQPGMSRLQSLQQLTLEVAARIIGGEYIDTVNSDTWNNAGLE